MPKKKSKKKSEPIVFANGDKPTKKVQITRRYMIDYIKASEDAEIIGWFKNLCNANKKEVETKARGKYVDIDIVPVRDEFVKRFFSDLIKEKKTDLEPTIFEELDLL